ncbi:hypothetical protein [Neoroseomonas soli]|uniref:Uncharacterized protein n=1 Tax=Neoroseomonas soli TaxID=1081025 RepID=A0A9X9WUF0_9PROT|nr:hypothetical protein [Neoroseomonas soli]MBR0670779.1 hypothetical protein [Neoroseomonas soli]
MAEPRLRAAAGVALVAASVALPAALLLLGHLSWGSALFGALGLLLWYPIDRLILAALETRRRTDQDRT